MGYTKTARKNQILLYKGEATSNVSVIVSGLVKMYTTLNNGNEVIVTILGPGDYFPVGYSLNQTPTSMFFHETLTVSEIEIIAADEFLRRQRNRPDINQYHARRYIGSLLHITALVQMTAYEKLAHTMRYLAIRFGTELPTKKFLKINIKLTHQIIADLANTSRETASIEIAKLKKTEVILEKNKYYYVDTKSITNLIGDELDESIHLQ